MYADVLVKFRVTQLPLDVQRPDSLPRQLDGKVVPELMGNT